MKKCFQLISNKINFILIMNFYNQFLAFNLFFIIKYVQNVEDDIDDLLSPADIDFALWVVLKKAFNIFVATFLELDSSGC